MLDTLITTSDLVFTTALGTPIEPRNLNRHFYSIREKAGLPDVRFHDLRHTLPTSPLGIRDQANLTGLDFGIALALAVIPTLTRTLDRTNP